MALVAIAQAVLRALTRAHQDRAHAWHVLLGHFVRRQVSLRCRVHALLGLFQDLKGLFHVPAVMWAPIKRCWDRQVAQVVLLVRFVQPPALRWLREYVLQVPSRWREPVYALSVLLQLSKQRQVQVAAMCVLLAPIARV